MAQTTALIHTLKRCLKAQGKTYADVARLLALSEASVKRIFAEEHLSLDRLERVCQMLGMEISDLVRQMEAERHHIMQLSVKQEREIIEDIELMLVTVCVFNHWSVDEIVSHFTLSRPQCISKLLKLEKIGLIDLLPLDRVRLRITRHFQWQPNGPFEQFFRNHIGQEFFRTHFHADPAGLYVVNGTISKSSAEEFKRRLQRLAREFSDMNREAAQLPLIERESLTLVMAMRHWDYGLFKHLVRE